jgi:hypothetical protein
MLKIVRKWKRRKPGVYAWRTDRHLNPARREWAYVGESVNIGLRDRCHLGTCGHKPKIQQLGNGTTLTAGRGCVAKAWTDLNPKRRTIIRLPWWLGFKWVLRPLETIVILALAPRYNWQKNAWNPRRVPPSTQAVQRAQRAERDGAGRAYQARVQAWRVGRLVMRVAGVLLIVAGLSGYLMTR